MENAVDALKMAAAVLVFVTALGISISSFSQARETADILIRYTDRESVTQYVENLTTKTRMVGKESIIPTIYRAFKENYRVQFYEKNGTPIVLYTKIEKGVTVEVNYIDLDREVIGNNIQQDNFIMALLYGKKGTLKNADGTSSKSFDEFKNELQVNNSGITLKEEGIYDTILSSSGVDYVFEEKYGVYYQDDLTTIDSDTDISDEYEDSKTPDVNKTKKRVISYYRQ